MRVDPSDPELSRSIIQAYLPFSNPVARHMSDISLNSNVLITLELSCDKTATGDDIVTAPHVPGQSVMLISLWADRSFISLTPDNGAATMACGG